MEFFLNIYQWLCGQLWRIFFFLIFSRTSWIRAFLWGIENCLRILTKDLPWRIFDFFFFWDSPFFNVFIYMSRTFWIFLWNIFPTNEHFLIFSGTSWRRIVNFLRVFRKDLSLRIFKNIFFAFSFFRCFLYVRTFLNSLQRFSVYLKFVNFRFSNFLTENLETIKKFFFYICGADFLVKDLLIKNHRFF